MKEGYLCNDCPRKCNVYRSYNEKPGDGNGFCRMGSVPVVAHTMLHQWEEPCISGKNGSGAVFFSGCSLKCVFCQNESISNQNCGEIFPENRLLKVFEKLIEKGAHNINLVTPTHFIRGIRNVLYRAKKSGLTDKIPIIYNTSGYENVDSLKMLDGLVDVYLPDLKFADDTDAHRFANADDYVEVSRTAVLEMFRQVGLAVYDENGLIERGLIIRHLILPKRTEKAISIINWISNNLPNEISVSVMSQYVPYGAAAEMDELNRRISKREAERVLNHLYKSNMTNGFVQQLESADKRFIPDFSSPGIIE